MRFGSYADISAFMNVGGGQSSSYVENGFGKKTLATLLAATALTGWYGCRPNDQQKDERAALRLIQQCEDSQTLESLRGVIYQMGMAVDKDRVDKAFLKKSRQLRKKEQSKQSWGQEAPPLAE